jgi:hypothetical protein
MMVAETVWGSALELVVELDETMAAETVWELE